MKRLLQFGWILLTALCVLPAVAAPAAAFVLEGPQILELMARQQDKLKSLQVTQTLIRHDEAVAGAGAEFGETIAYQFPDRFRSDITAVNLERLHVVNRDTALTVVDGRIAAESETAFDRYKDLLLHRGRTLLQNHLVRLGVDVAVTSFGRLGTDTAFVIGARYPDLSAPQVWIDQRHFRPVRFILPPASYSLETLPLDIRYENWRRINAVWYPRQILFYRGDQLVRELKISGLQKNPDFPAGFFDIQRLKARYRLPPPVPTGPDAPPSERNGQKTLKDIINIFD